MDIRLKIIKDFRLGSSSKIYWIVEKLLGRALVLYIRLDKIVISCCDKLKYCNTTDLLDQRVIHANMLILYKMFNGLIII